MWIAIQVLSSALGAQDAVPAAPAMPVMPAAPVASAPSTAPSVHRALTSDFEPDPALPQELPAGFFRLLTRDSGRDGFPPFGRVGVTDAIAASGSWSLEFQIAGGAMAVVSEPRQVPAGPGEVMEGSVMALIGGLNRSRAGLSISALDSTGRVIEGASWTAHGTSSAGWQQLLVRAGPMPEGTSAVEVALGVEPIDRGDPTGDVAGRVLFDSLELWRIPRIRFEVDRAGEPIGTPARGATVSIDDPCDAAATSLRLLDQDDRELAAWTTTGNGAVVLAFPPLVPGAYRLDAEVRGGERTLERASRTLAVLARTARPEPRVEVPVRFGLWVDRPTRAAARPLLDAVVLLRPDFVVIDLGDAAPDAGEALTVAELRRWCDDLRLERVEPILRISRVPPELAAALHIEIDDPAGVFDADDASWRSAYGAWFERFGHVVPRWMIAATPARAVPIEARLDGLVPAWRATEGAIEVVDAMPDATRTRGDRAAAEGIGHWRRGAAMIALRGAIGDEPGAAAIQWSALAAAARGAITIADLDAGSDLGCLLLSCDRSARVLVWRRDGGAPRPVTLPFDGESLRAVDTLGRPVELRRAQGAITAMVGSTPVVIDGVDPVLGRFLAAVRFEPARLEGSTAEQPMQLVLENPWDVTLEGTVRFVAPVEWSFIPRLQRFSLPPGAKGALSSRVTLPRSEITGATRVGVEFEFTSDRGYALRVDPAIELVVDAFHCEAVLRRVTLADGRPGALVELEIVNRSDRALELESTVFTLDGQARRDGPVRLEAGARARRTVRLDEPPRGSVTVSVNQTNGPLRLVRSIE